MEWGAQWWWWWYFPSTLHKYICFLLMLPSSSSSYFKPSYYCFIIKICSNTLASTPNNRDCNLLFLTIMLLKFIPWKMSFNWLLISSLRLFHLLLTFVLICFLAVYVTQNVCFGMMYVLHFMQSLLCYVTILKS